MTTDTEIKPGTEISVEDGEDLLISVTDGYGKLSILRYPLPLGVADLTHSSAGSDVVAPGVRLALYSVYFEVRFSGAAFSLTKSLATEIAEILLGRPLPEPHNCTVPGCNHGHAA